jgi:hypothetical protein
LSAEIIDLAAKRAERNARRTVALFAAAGILALTWWLWKGRAQPKAS